MHGLTLPQSDTYVLTGATVPVAATEINDVSMTHEGLAMADIVIREGLISAILKAGAADKTLPSVPLSGRMVWPCFTDMHTHLDKGHIWQRTPNPDGSFDGALEAVRADSAAHWSADDVAKRMDFSLRCAFAHGTSLMRTHIDSLGPQHRISLPLFQEMRTRWKGRIELQAASLFPLYATADDRFFPDLLAVLRETGGILGGLTQPGPNLDSELDRLLQAASEIGVDVDLHVDETADPTVLTLASIADAVLRNNYEGTVTVGHCCSLARQDGETAKRAIEKVVKANLAVVSLPMCNLYLQDRHAGRTPRWRGVTLFHELRTAGVRTAIASDNTRDPFYAYGDLDPVEVFRESVRILHLDHPLDHAPSVITKIPADILGRKDKGRIAVGTSADLVIFKARRWSELLSRPQSDRTIIRGGRVVERVIPDYDELDTIHGA